MSSRLNIQKLRQDAKKSMWSAAVSVIHGIFGPVVTKRVLHKSFKALITCVYRHENAPIVLRYVAEAVQRGWEVRLWALDQIHPALKAYSRGSGKGPRCALLNALIGGTDLSAFDWIIVMDDDFEFQRGSLASFLAIAEGAGISLAQPARAYGRYRSFRLINRNPLGVARLTSYVEIGPIIAVNQAWASRILPFPESYGMGWGLDLLWSDLRKEGLRLGVIDWVTINHLSPVGKAYDNSPEKLRLTKMLHDRGFQSIEETQKTLAVWRPWQQRPLWLRETNETQHVLPNQRAKEPRHYSKEH
jgi:hypothetical protein